MPKETVKILPSDYYFSADSKSFSVAKRYYITLDDGREIETRQQERASFNLLKPQPLPEGEEVKPEVWPMIENDTFEADVDAFTGVDGMGAAVKKLLQIA